MADFDLQAPSGKPVRPAPTQGMHTRTGVDLDRIREYVLEVYRWSRDHHEKTCCKEYLEFYRLYKNIVDKRIDPDTFKSNIGVSMAYPIVEIVAARVMTPWYSGDQIIQAFATKPQDVEKAPRVAAWINDKLRNRIPRMFSKANLVGKSGLLYGRGISKTHIRSRPAGKRLRREPVMLPSPMGPIPVANELTWKDTPPSRTLDVAYCDPFDTWWTPGERFFEYADWMFEQNYMTHAEALARFSTGEFDAADPAEVKPGDAIGYDEYRLRRMQIEHGRSMGDGRYEKQHHYIEFSGRCEVEDGVWEDCTVGILDKRLVVKYGPLSTWNGRPPYLVWEPNGDTGGDRAIGLIEVIRDILYEINDYENIALDNARMTIERTLLVDPMATKQDKILIGAGAVNWVRNPAMTVKALEMGTLGSDFYNQIGYLGDLVQRLSGVSDWFGLGGSGAEQRAGTATGMTLMANLASSRFAPVMGAVDQEWYRPLARDLQETARLRMETAETVRMTGPGAMPMMPGMPQAPGMGMPGMPPGMPGMPGMGGGLASPFSTVGPDDMGSELDFAFNTKALDPGREQARKDFLDAMTLINTQFGPALAARGMEIDPIEASRMILDKFDQAGNTQQLLTPMMQAAGVPMGSPEAATPGGVPGLPGRVPMPPPAASPSTASKTPAGKAVPPGVN